MPTLLLLVALGLLLIPDPATGSDDLHLLGAAPTVPRLDGVIVERGWNDPPERSPGGTAADTAFETIARAGATAVAVDAVALVARDDSPFVDTPATPRTVEVERVRWSVARARTLGLRLVLRLRVDRLDGGPRERIAMGDEEAWSKFFGRLRAWCGRWAATAEDTGVDLLVLPSALSGTTHREQDWRRLVAAVRARYDGPLTLGAGSVDEAARIGFWDEFDLIGIELHEPVARPGDDDPEPRPRPTVWSAADEDSVAVEEIARALAPRLRRLAATARRWQRPVVVAAAGYRSVERAWRVVRGSVDRFAPPDERDQARAIAGTLRALDRTGAKAWSRGVLWHGYDLVPDDDDPEVRRRWSRSSSVRAKRAFDTLTAAWRRGGGAHRVVGTGGAVVSSDSTATRVGIDVLRAGGTAADAAVAMAFVLCVVRPDAAGLGGGGSAVVHDPRAGATLAFDFGLRAPLAAHEFFFEELETEGLTAAASRGPLAAAIPGTIPGLARIHARHGDLDWSTLLRPALEAAARGAPIRPATAGALAAERNRLQGFASTRRLYLPSGRLLQEGETLVRPRLAETLLALGREGPDVWTHGRIGRAVVEDVRRAGGIWTTEDLAATPARVRAAVRWPLSRDGRSVLHTTAPPSTSSLVLPWTWTLLEAQRAETRTPAGPARGRAWIEALRLTLPAARSRIGEPLAMPVPLHDLLAHDELSRLTRRLPGTGVRGTAPTAPADEPRRERGATHLAVIDAAGRAVAMTLEMNGPFGAAWIAPSTGIGLNDGMLRFDAAADPVSQPTRPDRVRPGAAVPTATTPVVVTRDGRVRLALTASGTPDAPAAVAQVLHRRLVDVWPLDRAVAAPRLGLAGPAATFELDRVRPGWARAMRRAGHRIQSMSGSAPVHALERDARGTLRAVSDPRTPGSARTVD